MAFGICKLCRKEAELQNSHYVPSALYPKNVRLQYSTPNALGITEEHVTDPLLCWSCEQRFARSGESEVLRHIAAKSRKRFPLHEKLRLAYPREDHPDLKRFVGYDLGLDMDKFAYFMLSVVWRGAVHQWTRMDGTLTTALQLGGFEEPIRQYLLGGLFPPDTAVIVIVSSDDISRNCWFAPAPFDEAGCSNFGFHAMGIYFRAMLGKCLPQLFRDSCSTSPRKCIFYGNTEKKTLEAFHALHVMRGHGQTLPATDSL